MAVVDEQLAVAGENEHQEDAPRSLPIAEGLAQAGEAVSIAGGAIAALFKPPFRWRGEFTDQAHLTLRRVLLATAFANFVFGFGAPGMVGVHIIQVFGTVDRMGAFSVMASFREFAPWVNAMLVAGVVGTSVCADLGARKVRDELDAFEVMGLSVTAELIAPRFLAIAVLTPLLDIVAGVCGVIGVGFAAVTVTHGTTVSGYASTFYSNFTLPDLLGSVVKSACFGVIIATICCYKGLKVKGGAEGVGRAVNQAVVFSFIGIFVFNYMFTSALLALFPQTTNLH